MISGGLKAGGAKDRVLRFLVPVIANRAVQEVAYYDDDHQKRH